MAVETRQLHAIQIKLKSPADLSVVVWPFENREGCCRLTNSKRTWMTAKAGDSVLLKGEKGVESKRYFIEAVTLFRALSIAKPHLKVFDAENNRNW